MTDVASNCTEHIRNLLLPVSNLNSKVFHVLDQDDLLNAVKMFVPPCAGVWYNGLEVRSGDAQKGLNTDVGVTVVLLLNSKSPVGQDEKNRAAVILDKMRGVVVGRRSPTAHIWRFAGEVPAGVFNGMLVYLQKWKTAYPAVGKASTENPLLANWGGRGPQV